jgi:hypothetical protein
MSAATDPASALAACARLREERDRARAIAVALEAQVARVEALRAKWASERGNATDYDYGRWHRAAAIDLGEALGDVRRWRPSDGDTRCQACGKPNAVWFTSADLWNATMGDEGGILCIPCFITRAEDRLGGVVWSVEVRR